MDFNNLFSEISADVVDELSDTILDTDSFRIE